MRRGTRVYIMDKPKVGDQMRVGDLLTVQKEVWEVQRVNDSNYEMVFVGHLVTDTPIEHRGLVIGELE